MGAESIFGCFISTGCDDHAQDGYRRRQACICKRVRRDAWRVNPDIKVPEGAVVQINLVNGDGAVHDIVVPEFDTSSSEVSGKGAATAVVFRATRNGNFEYYCSLPGHKAAGMVGRLIVGDGPDPVAQQGNDLTMDPSKVGEPVGKREPKNLTIDLRTTEEEGRLSDGSSYRFWTFNGTVPGR